MILLKILGLYILIFGLIVLGIFIISDFNF